MPKFILVIREPGSDAHDYSLPFDAPQVPSIGDYISIQRPDVPEPYGEDLVVRHVWWRLKTPVGLAGSAEQPEEGSLIEVMVEADPAIGPYSSDHWHKVLDGREDTETFKISRFSIGEKAMREG